MKDAVVDHDLKIKELLRQCRERNFKRTSKKPRERRDGAVEQGWRSG